MLKYRQPLKFRRRRHHPFQCAGVSRVDVKLFVYNEYPNEPLLMKHLAHSGKGNVRAIAINASHDVHILQGTFNVAQLSCTTMVAQVL